MYDKSLHVQRLVTYRENAKFLHYNKKSTQRFSILLDVRTKKRNLRNSLSTISVHVLIIVTFASQKLKSSHGPESVMDLHCTSVPIRAFAHHKNEMR